MTQQCWFSGLPTEREETVYEYTERMLNSIIRSAETAVMFNRADNALAAYGCATGRILDVTVEVSYFDEFGITLIQLTADNGDVFKTDSPARAVKALCYVWG